VIPVLVVTLSFSRGSRRCLSSAASILNRSPSNNPRHPSVLAVKRGSTQPRLTARTGMGSVGGWD
jgi:hypothetical protein